jgi:hypothetical protein
VLHRQEGTSRHVRRVGRPEPGHVLTPEVGVSVGKAGEAGERRQVQNRAARIVSPHALGHSSFDDLAVQVREHHPHPARVGPEPLA